MKSLIQIIMLLIISTSFKTPANGSPLLRMVGLLPDDSLTLNEHVMLSKGDTLRMVVKIANLGNIKDSSLVTSYIPEFPTKGDSVRGELYPGDTIINEIYLIIPMDAPLGLYDVNVAIFYNSGKDTVVNTFSIIISSEAVNLVPVIPLPSSDFKERYNILGNQVWSHQLFGFYIVKVQIGKETVYKKLILVK